MPASAHRPLVALGLALVALAACRDTGTTGDAVSLRPLDAWDRYARRLAATTSADQIEAALSLGQSLALHHVVMDVTGSAERATPQVFDEYETSLGIELPSEALTPAFDPRATELTRRISASTSRTVARFFALSYHGHYASLLAGRLSSEEIRASPLSGLFELGLTVHMNIAQNAAQELELPQETIDEGRAIVALIRRAVDAESPPAPQAFDEIGDRLSSWLSPVSGRLPFSMRLMAPGGPTQDRP